MVIENEKLRPMVEWWDIFWWIVAEGQQALREDLATGGEAVGIFDKIKAFRILRQHDKLLKKRRKLQKALHKDLRGFFADTPPTHFAYGGVTISEDGVAYDDPDLPTITLHNLLSQDQVYCAGDEASMILSFLVFYRTQAFGEGGEAEDPDSFVRAVLKSKGITRENYRTHPASPGYLGADHITYPFGEEPRGILGADGRPLIK